MITQRNSLFTNLIIKKKNGFGSLFIKIFNKSKILLLHFVLKPNKNNTY